MGKFPKRFNPLGLIVVVLGLLATLLSSTLLKDWIIIGFGVRTFNLIKTISIGIIILGIIITVLTLIPVITAALRQNREQQQQAQTTIEPTEDIYDPKTIRQHLLQLKVEFPALAKLIDRFIAQMDHMDAIQARQNRLIQENSASYLSKTEEVLNNVERRLCRNIRKFINLCIGTGGCPTEKVNQIYDSNETILAQASSLTVVSTDYINKYTTSQYDYHGDIDQWIQTIQESLKED